MMKLNRFILFIAFLIQPSLLIKAEKPIYQLDIGYMLVNNNLNRNDYYINNERSFNEKYIVKPTYGLNLKLSKSTSLEYIRLCVGSLFIQSPASYTLNIIPDHSKALYYRLNGGGVYVGICPTIGNKNIGLTADLGIGVFSFKEYRSIYHYDESSDLDTFDRRGSSGLGAISSVGFYAKLGKMGINPQLQAIYSGGGGDTSFTFWGLNIPLTFSF